MAVRSVLAAIIETSLKVGLIRSQEIVNQLSDIFD